MSKESINIRFDIIAIVCIAIFCFAIVPITLQNDTFYTIKIGELIVNNGIDMKDHFSWNEDLPYTYPHWAYDTGIYLIYHLGELSRIKRRWNDIYIFINCYFNMYTWNAYIYNTSKNIKE